MVQTVVNSFTYRRMMVLFMATNILSYLDRGIIPGAPVSFTAFIKMSLNETETGIYFGALTSVFIIGYTLASIVVGQAVHSIPPMRVIGYGLLVHMVAVFFSGLAAYLESYWFLFVARCFSGVGEASFCAIAPTFIDDRVPSRSKATWMALFYVAIPLGIGMGYVYSGFIAESIGWQCAFYIEAFLFVPCVVYCFLLDELRLKGTRDLSARATFSGVKSHSPVARVPLKDIRSIVAVGSTQTSATRTFEDRNIQDAQDEEALNTEIGEGRSQVLGQSGKALPSREITESIAQSSPNDGELPRRGSQELEDNSEERLLDIAIPSSQKDKALTMHSPSAFLASDSVSPTSPNHTLMFLKEAREIFSNPVYTATVLGQAAFAFVFSGLSVFAPQMVLEVGFFETESAASFYFGLVATLAGIIGSPLGGFLLDHYGNRDSTARSEEEDSTNNSMESHLQFKVYTALLHQLAYALFGFLMMSIAPWAQTAWLFLFSVFIGLSIEMANQGPSLFVSVNAVSLRSRSLALGLQNVVIHVLGDVPAPMIIGAIKDFLAPSVVPQNLTNSALTSPTTGMYSKQSSTILSPQGQAGVRLTMFLVILWLLWHIACNIVALLCFYRQRLRILTQLGATVGFDSRQSV